MNKILPNITFIFFGFSCMLMAQTDDNKTPVVREMITDRPDATESPNTVPLKSLQIETGGFYESFEENDFKTETLGYNTTLFRYGLLENLELRLGWNFEERRFSNNGQKIENVTSGFSPLLAGIKVAITEEKGLFPEIGLLVHIALPFLASTDYHPETTGVDFRFAFAHALNEKSSVSYNLGAKWGDDSPEAAYIYTVSYGYSISNKIGAYVEIYGNFPEDNKANHLWDAGLTYSIQNNLQIDATIGSSITKGQDILLSTGISYRLPN